MRGCSICNDDYGGQCIPTLLSCCGNEVCFTCAENWRSAQIAELPRNRKKIKCMLCNHLFHCRSDTPWIVNRPFISLQGIDVDMSIVREVQSAMQVSTAAAITTAVRSTRSQRRHETENNDEGEDILLEGHQLLSSTPTLHRSQRHSPTGTGYTTNDAQSDDEASDTLYPPNLNISDSSDEDISNTRAQERTRLRRRAANTSKGFGASSSTTKEDPTSSDEEDDLLGQIVNSSRTEQLSREQQREKSEEEAVLTLASLHTHAIANPPVTQQPSNYNDKAQKRKKSLSDVSSNGTGNASKKKKKKKKSFEQRIEDLQEYKEKYGHVNVKEREDKSLYGFCSHMRRARKHPKKSNTIINEERIASLDALGFIWSIIKEHYAEPEEEEEVSSDSESMVDEIDESDLDDEEGCDKKMQGEGELTLAKLNQPWRLCKHPNCNRYKKARLDGYCRVHYDGHVKEKSAKKTTTKKVKVEEEKAPVKKTLTAKEEVEACFAPDPEPEDDPESMSTDNEATGDDLVVSPLMPEAPPTHKSEYVQPLTPTGNIDHAHKVVDIVDCVLNSKTSLTTLRNSSRDVIKDIVRKNSEIKFGNQFWNNIKTLLHTAIDSKENGEDVDHTWLLKMYATSNNISGDIYKSKPKPKKANGSKSDKELVVFEVPKEDNPFNEWLQRRKAQWVKQRKRKYKSAGEDDNEVNKDKASGEVMEPVLNKSSVSKFKQRIEDLKAYKEEHGHIDVRKSDDKSLYDFCRKMRQARTHPEKSDRTINEERIASMDALGFDWGVSTREQVAKKSFEQRIVDLRAYKEKHGHVNVKQSEDKSLNKFCERIRYARTHPGKSNAIINDDHIASLDALGFDWSTKQQESKSFAQRLEDLKAYKEKHGDVNVKESEDRSLYDFYKHIRHARKCPEKRIKAHNNPEKYPAFINDDRIASLDALGFDWSIRERAANKSFDERVDELRTYKEKQGHVNVKHKEDKSLYNFCLSIRKKRKHPGKSRWPLITDDRIASLDALGFDWSANSAKSFAERIEDLRAYKQMHGHIRVKESKDKRLSDFCARVRHGYNNPGKGAAVTEDQIASLNTLGFDWSTKEQAARKSFEQRILDLKAYKDKNGHIRVKKSEDKSLYQFCNDVRCARKNPGKYKGTLKTDERIASLDALGFDWS